MRIDLLKTSPDRAGRYYVQFSDGSSMRLYRQTLEDFGLYVGLEMTLEEFQKLHSAASAMSAKMRAVRIVSATNVSCKDLEKRLIQKGEQPDKARDAVSWLEDLHLVDDRKTAEQIVHSCISKGYGLSRAKQALYEKRIPKGLWNEALADYPDQKEKIYSFLQSRLSGSWDERSVKKAVDSLLRRGHSYGVIREVLADFSVDSDDLLEES